MSSAERVVRSSSAPLTRSLTVRWPLAALRVWLPTRRAGVRWWLEGFPVYGDPAARRAARLLRKEDITAMRQEEITALFDQQASTYDQQWSKTAPINAALHFLTRAVLAELPPKAKILCVGSGTGAEILYLAQHFPEWHFTAVEPSTAMLDVFRRRAEEHGISSRCVFHPGYLDALPSHGSFDAATAFLVSHFILERHSRSAFFQSIAERLRPEGILLSSDLAGDLAAADCQDLLEVWFRVMSGSGATPSHEGIARMREAYSRDVAILPPQELRDILRRGGFDSPVLFFQAGMIHAWYAKRTPSQPGPLIGRTRLTPSPG